MAGPLNNPRPKLRCPSGVGWREGCVRDCLASAGDPKTDSTWPARLERHLQETYRGTRFELINAGQDGYTRANEAELLRRLGWQFNPDLVVVQFYTNDALPSGPDFKHPSRDVLYPEEHLLPLRFRTGEVRTSALLLLLDDELLGLVAPVADRLGRGLELLGQLLGSPPSPHQLDQLAAELRRIGRPGLRHRDILLSKE